MKKQKIGLAFSLSLILCLLLSLLTGCHIDENNVNNYDSYGYVAFAKVAYNGEIASIEGVEGIIEIDLDSWYFTSGVPNNAIKVKYPTEDEKVTFECKTNKGKFWWGNEYVDKATIKQNDTIYWHADSDIPCGDTIYIDIIVKNDQNIIGYAVIEAEQTENSLEFTAKVLKTEIYPKINDKFQEITEEYVSKAIEKIQDGSTDER